MSELAESDGNRAYPPAALLEDLRTGIFSDLSKETVSINLYRRNLQRAYVDKLAANLTKPASNSDLPALARSELAEIRVIVHGAIEKNNGVSKAHLMDLAARIALALDPKK